MPASQATATLPERGPVSRAVGVVLSLVAAAVFPIDRVLRGMVGAGLGIEAICLYLGLSRANLHDNLVRLDLRTPHDRPVAKARAKGWSVDDTKALVVWRIAGVHPADIGERLGGRSGNAIRSKARRLGLPAPSRKELRRVNPASLVVPAAGIGHGAPGAAFDAQPTAASRCGMATDMAGGMPAPEPADSPAAPPSQHGAPLHPLRTAAGFGAAGAVHPARRPTSKRPEGQRELSLLQIVPVRDAPAASPARDEPSPVPHTTSNLAEDVRRLASDVSVLKKRRRWTSNRDVVEAVSLRYFGRQSYKDIAADIGVSERTVSSFLYRVGVPRDKCREKFSAKFDLAMAEENLAKSGYVLDVCRKTHQYFWRHKRDSGIKFNRETRIAMGRISEWEKFKSETIVL